MARAATTTRSRVLLLADTHGVLDARIAALAVECDVVVHAGDVGNAAVLETLRAGGAHVIAVRVATTTSRRSGRAAIETSTVSTKSPASTCPAARWSRRTAIVMHRRRATRVCVRRVPGSARRRLWAQPSPRRRRRRGAVDSQSRRSGTCAYLRRSELSRPCSFAACLADRGDAFRARQRPLKTGLRRSRNARVPSRMSSLAKQFANVCAS